MFRGDNSVHIHVKIQLGTDHLTWRGDYGFLFRSEFFFSDNTRVRIFIFFVAQSAKYFFQNSTLGYMTKTLNQIIFFPPPKSEYFFSNIGNQNIFLEKKHNPPFKLNGRSLTSFLFHWHLFFYFISNNNCPLFTINIVSFIFFYYRESKRHFVYITKKVARWTSSIEK